MRCCWLPRRESVRKHIKLRLDGVIGEIVGIVADLISRPEMSISARLGGLTGGARNDNDASS